MFAKSDVEFYKCFGEWISTADIGKSDVVNVIERGNMIKLYTVTTFYRNTININMRA